LYELSTKAARKLVAKISRMKVTATVQLDKGDNRLVRRGVVMARRGDWEEAARYWNDAVNREPADAASYYNLGVAHESIGDAENLSVARDFYEKAASLGDNPLYAEGVARIDRIVGRGKNL
jgi:TPR repeat protein